MVSAVPSQSRLTPDFLTHSVSLDLSAEAPLPIVRHAQSQLPTRVISVRP